MGDEALGSTFIFYTKPWSFTHGLYKHWPQRHLGWKLWRLESTWRFPKPLRVDRWLQVLRVFVECSILENVSAPTCPLFLFFYFFILHLSVKMVDRVKTDRSMKKVLLFYLKIYSSPELWKMTRSWFYSVGLREQGANFSWFFTTFEPLCGAALANTPFFFPSSPSPLS